MLTTRKETRGLGTQDPHILQLLITGKFPTGIQIIIEEF